MMINWYHKGFAADINAAGSVEFPSLDIFCRPQEVPNERKEKR